jgi:5,5'-dehydrodivanillate O-demethylase
MMAWITQGDISDRTTERLGTSDKGVILFRSLLLEQMEKVERGEDPMGVVRDRAKNEPFIRIGREEVALEAFAIKRDLTRAADKAVLTPSA